MEARLQRLLRGSVNNIGILIFSPELSTTTTKWSYPMFGSPTNATFCSTMNLTVFRAFPVRPSVNLYNEIRGDYMAISRGHSADARKSNNLMR